MSQNYPHPLLAREGWPFIAATLVLALLATVLFPWWAAALCWLLAVFVIQFFRDPGREIPTDTAAILAPADGRVIKVEKSRDAQLDRDALKISIFMNVFNVHSNRSPARARVVETKYTAGKFFNADLDKASDSNERNSLVLERDDGARITCVQVAGLVARRILCYVKAGDQLTPGQRFG